ncbi:hypothetical protein DET59_10183 [Rossellomorea aquimaris]|uniref:Uncharacterized protein n=1 Tax=Rossellomorea aquimaris TaxID=189382 RepID=A0A366EZ74_9BACI|nr:hypothetical protein DET59_10183 [Rossellomorea aquimaris]
MIKYIEFQNRKNNNIIFLILLFPNPAGETPGSQLKRLSAAPRTPGAEIIYYFHL